jgi:hypothetical protein
VKAPSSIPPAARRTVPDIPVTHTQPSFARPAAGAAPPVRSSRSVLTQLSFDAVAYVTLTAQEIKRRPIDPHQAFVIGLIDGRSTIESVLDTCPLSTHQVLRILGELLREGVIALR